MHKGAFDNYVRGQEEGDGGSVESPRGGGHVTKSR